MKKIKDAFRIFLIGIVLGVAYALFTYIIFAIIVITPALIGGIIYNVIDNKSSNRHLAISILIAFLMGITTYVSYISMEYAIMRFELFKQVAKVTSIQEDINSIVDQTINTYTLKHTGYTGIKGYLLVRTRRFGTWNRMLDVIDGPNTWSCRRVI